MLMLTVISAVYYIFSNLLIGTRDVYNATYYFPGIMAVTILISLVLVWLIEYKHYKSGIRLRKIEKSERKTEKSEIKHSKFTRKG